VGCGTSFPHTCFVRIGVLGWPFGVEEQPHFSEFGFDRALLGRWPRRPRWRIPIVDLAEQILRQDLN